MQCFRLSGTLRPQLVWSCRGELRATCWRALSHWAPDAVGSIRVSLDLAGAEGRATRHQAPRQGSDMTAGPIARPMNCVAADVSIKTPQRRAGTAAFRLRFEVISSRCEITGHGQVRGPGASNRAEPGCNGRGLQVPPDSGPHVPLVATRPGSLLPGGVGISLPGSMTAVVVPACTE